MQEKITKQRTLDFSDYDKDKQQFITVITDDSVDADAEVVIPKGIDLKRYRTNPVILFGHNHQQPIGKTLWIKSDGGNRLIAKAQITAKTELGRDVYSLISEGILRAVSIGFFATEISEPTEKELKNRPDWENAKRVIRKSEMFEWSVVAVPSNPNALVLAKDLDLASETIKMLEDEAGKEVEDLIESQKERYSMQELQDIAMNVINRKTIVIDYAKVVDDVLANFGKQN